jgi:hypothetical protein
LKKEFWAEGHEPFENSSAIDKVIWWRFLQDGVRLCKFLEGRGNCERSVEGVQASHAPPDNGEGIITQKNQQISNFENLGLCEVIIGHRMTCSLPGAIVATVATVGGSTKAPNPPPKRINSRRELFEMSSEVTIDLNVLRIVNLREFSRVMNFKTIPNSHRRNVVENGTVKSASIRAGIYSDAVRAGLMPRSLFFQTTIVPRPRGSARSHLNQIHT